jgi:hypothetical protein
MGILESGYFQSLSGVQGEITTLKELLRLVSAEKKRMLLTRSST